MEQATLDEEGRDVRTLLSNADVNVLQDAVKVDISYAIIHQMSEQLYSNPRKAVEELVCNAYDAGARRCYVMTPISNKNRIAVLDDGVSMDLNGLKDLWAVARSPKARGDSQGVRIANGRRQIGKFGVGKLAGFALGKSLTHIAKKDQKIRVVTVTAGKIRDRDEGGDGEPRTPSFNVYEMNADSARDTLAPLFEGVPDPWEEKWATWTMAILEDLDAEIVTGRLQPGFLPMMVGTALPLGADFTVWIDRKEVEKRTIPEDDVLLRYSVHDENVKKIIEEHLESQLKEYNKEHGLPEPTENQWRVADCTLIETAGKGCAAIFVPQLGPVAGEAFVSRIPLATAKREKRGYSDNGFWVRAMGKIINPDNPLFWGTEKTHGHWLRFRADVEVPELDRILRVQRNALDESDIRASLARAVLDGVYAYGRREFDRQREKKAEREHAPFGTTLLRMNPLEAQFAVAGLRRGELSAERTRGLRITYQHKAATERFSSYDEKENKILVNREHPSIDRLDQTRGGAKKVREVASLLLRDILGSFQMGVGFLRERGVSDDDIAAFEEFSDQLVRQAADNAADVNAELCERLEQLSYTGGTPFEKIAMEVLRRVCWNANHVGGPGKPDGVMHIVRSGQKDLKVCVEAKGSNGVVSHEVLRASTVERHAKKEGCEAKVAIAREFQLSGFGGDISALLEESKHISLMTVAALQHMVRMGAQRPFTYSQLEKILTTPQSPDNLIQFIDEVHAEAVGLPKGHRLRLVLEVVHSKASKGGMDLPDLGAVSGDDRILEAGIPKEEIRAVLTVLNLVGAIFLKPKTMEYLVETNVDGMLEYLAEEYGSGVDP